MVRKFLQISVMLSGLLFSINSVAGLIVDEVIIDDKTNTLGDFHLWFHDLSSYDFDLNEALSGTLTIELWDDKEGACGRGFAIFNCESASITVGLLDFSDDANWLVIDWSNLDDEFTTSLGNNSLSIINQFGALSVSIASWGDFWIGKSTLEIVTSDLLNKPSSQVDVPAPSVLLIFAFSIISLLYRRK